MVAKAGYQEWGEDVGTSNKAGGESQRGNLKEGGTPGSELRRGITVTILRARPGRVFL
jgi:hypothetical protein